MAKNGETKYWNTRLREAAEYIPGEQPQGLESFIKLNTNENPFPPSKAVLEAIRAAANETLKRYPDPTARVLRETYAAAKGIDPECVFVGNGSDEIFTLIFRGFIEPDGLAAFAYPSYALYSTLAEMNGIAYDTVPLNKDFSYNLAGFLKKKRDLVIIANPNNPTGTINTRQQIERLLDRLPERALCVLDEAYYEYIEDPDYPQSIDYVRQGRNVVVLRTFSKIYALAGLRVGYGIASPEIVRYIDQVREPFNVNTVAQYAAAASLQDPEQVTRSRRVNSEGKKQFCDAFDRLGLGYAPSQANFVFVDFGRDSVEVSNALMRKGVIIRAGNTFGTPTCARVTIGTREENERFIRALEEVLA